jgi:hypothetical protein
MIKLDSKAFACRGAFVPQQLQLITRGEDDGSEFERHVAVGKQES